MKKLAEFRVAHQCRNDRGRIGEARGFDENPFKPVGVALLRLGQRKVNQVASNGATDAARVEEQHIFAHLFHEKMIERPRPAR